MTEERRLIGIHRAWRETEISRINGKRKVNERFAESK